MSAFVVYVAFDIKNRPLYVGQTCNLKRRLGEHRRGSHWWSQVAFVSKVECSDRADALEVEADRIATLRPTYNVYATASYRETVADRMADDRPLTIRERKAAALKAVSA